MELNMGWIPRQHPRFKATLSVELHPKGATVPLRTQTSDIGLGGCYVEMIFTQEVSTLIDITLWIGDSKVCAAAEVVSKHPGFGNGLKFIQLSKEGREKLGQYLATLNPQERMENQSPVAGGSIPKK
jgi:c-di-GMP-binding flagellar brake protein YcgR